MNAIPTDAMTLEVVTPASVVIDATASKVTAEATTGSFSLLPRHVDIVASLVPGLVSFVEGGRERTVAVDGGMLVKQGPAVRIATAEAAEGEGVLALQRALRASLEGPERLERRSRAALARLESDAVRRLIELDDDE